MDNVLYITSDSFLYFYYTDIMLSEHLLFFFNFFKLRSLSGLYNSPITMLGYMILIAQGDKLRYRKAKGFIGANIL